MKRTAFSLRNRVDRLFIGALALVALALHWRWFLPGIITDQDWWNYSDTAMRALWPIPSTFNFDANAGADWRTSINYFPMESIMGLLAHLGANFALAERLVVLFPTVLLAPIAAYLLLRLYASRPAGAFAGALFYANNAYIDVIIARGQMTIAESYAIAPLVVYCAVRSVRSPQNPRLAVATAMAFAAAVIFDVRIALLTACVTVLVALFETRWAPSAARSVARNAGLVLLSCAGLLAFVWLPVAALHLHEAPPLDYTSSSWIFKLTGPTVWDLLTAYHPLWYTNVFSQWQPFYVSYFVLLTVGLLSLILTKRKRIAVCLALIIAISTLFAAAGNTPFGAVYEWLFVRSWFIGLFRDPSKFYAPAMLAYSLCIAVAATHIASLGRRRFTIPIIGAICFLALFPTLPAAIGQQAQLYAPKRPTTAEVRLRDELQRDSAFSRVLWVGATDRLVPGDYVHPAVDMLWFGAIAHPQHTVVESANSALAALKALGVGYVVVRTDSGEGLDYDPSRLIYKTLRTYARFGAFGPPEWSADGLGVFRLPNVIAAQPINGPAYVLPTSTVPVVPRAGTAQHPDGVPVVRGHEIAVGGGVIALPADLTLANSTAAYVRGPDVEALWQRGAAIRILAIPELERIRIASKLGGKMRIPDWTGYLMLNLVTRAGARASVTVEGFRFYERYDLGRIAPGRHYVTLPLRNAPKDVTVSLSTRALAIESAWRVPQIYRGLVDAGALGRPRDTRALPIDVPLAAAVKQTPTAASARSIDVNASPAELRAVLATPGRYGVPFAYTGLWRAAAGHAAVVHPAKADSLLEVKTTERELYLASAADPLLREGAIAATIAWLFLTVVLIGWKLRDMSIKTIQTRVQHTTQGIR
ncbi:MAG TPA: hypothetical protein VJP85_11955 [Candidatus Baltobacteraceae bacterium]|nr:hypothetical protein [Candidatus Baltobacteraceae bacterium]